MFIGLRPFTIFMDGDTIYVYTPNTSIVRANNGKIMCGRPGRFFSRIETDKLKNIRYSPSICCKIPQDGIPTWIVPENESECSGNVIYDIIGTVIWDYDLGKWVIDQKVIGSHKFNYYIDKASSLPGQTGFGKLTEDMGSIILSDGSIQELSEEETEELMSLGYSSGDEIPYEISYSYEDDTNVQ